MWEILERMFTATGERRKHLNNRGIIILTLLAVSLGLIINLEYVDAVDWKHKVDDRLAAIELLVQRQGQLEKKIDRIEEKIDNLVSRER